MKVLHVVWAAVLLALLPLHAWSAVRHDGMTPGVPAACHGARSGPSMLQAWHADTFAAATGMRESTPRRSNRFGLALDPARGARDASRSNSRGLCHALCGVVLAPSTAPTAWQLARVAAHRPSFRTRLVASALPDAPYHPPRV
ncbi:MAG: hypothetical protein KGL51_15680 [Betaproteobacteria bacterium]|nr:hypothetical protein [Betaproteobacteria bacterium]MDE2124706.1 hypothetical protein [Betaproteobacteria bacterium]MDE2186985.1 hypothetical protein [Betaproteobacteria bacterium]MDE2326080.1 hypothetical protein [Betaproteobacteria bacterium]